MNMRIQHWTPESLRRGADIIEEIRKLNDEFDSILVGEPQTKSELYEPPFKLLGSKPNTPGTVHHHMGSDVFHSEPKRKWSAARRRKFKRTMRRKYKDHTRLTNSL